ncbi:MAG: hypothetical protein HOV68_19630 [Streptomycetaceae bacterium]|nr:hypothetical protein [Streptomycetaceae bacterium]
MPNLPDRHSGARAAADAGTATEDTAPAGPDDDAGPEDKDTDGKGGNDGSATGGETTGPKLTGPGASSAARANVLSRTQSMAGARTNALKNNDPTAFAAAVDKNNKALLDSENRLFANLRKVPFEQSTWTTKNVTDARTDPGATGGWPVTATVEVVFHHKVAGADVRPVAERYVWTVHCLTATDACGITGVTGAADSTIAGPAGYPAPWDVWDLAVERRPHVVAMGPVATAADLRARADEAEAAAVYDLGVWKGPAGTSPGFVITLTRERATFERLYSRESPGDWAAGFALPLSAADDADQVGGSRVVIDLDEMDQDPAFAKIILRHEMMHALLDPITHADYDRIPLWAAEGFADWAAQADRPIRGTYEARAVAAQIKDGSFTGTLPSDRDFDSDDEDAIDAAYNQSHLAVRYLADTYGADKACAFIADVYQGRSGSIDAAIRAATGKSLTEFQKGWADWTRKNFG